MNISNLVKAVKEKKEKEYDLFDKIKYICHNFGEKHHEKNMESYLYEGDNLTFWLIEEGSWDKDIIQITSILDKDCETLFEYKYHPLLGKGNLERDTKGNWKDLVQDHYRMALYNINI